MGEIVLGVLVHAALLYAAIRIYLLARKLRNAGRTLWRRRVGLLFFFLPLLSWFAGLLLPEPLLAPLHALLWFSRQLDAALATMLGGLQQQLGTLWRLVLAPACYAIVYGGAGILIGWPLDLLRNRGRETGEG